MATYVDYAFYEDVYLGTEITPADFDRLALLASKQIDRFTFKRAADIIDANEPADHVKAIKMATCAVADEIKRQDDLLHKEEIKSESVGSHSVTYAGSGDERKTVLEQELTKQREAARIWLEETGLMFPGFYSGEYGTQVGEG